MKVVGILPESIDLLTYTPERKSVGVTLKAGVSVGAIGPGTIVRLNLFGTRFDCAVQLVTPTKSGAHNLQCLELDLQ